MKKCEHSADRGYCGYRACTHYGRLIPPNQYREGRQPAKPGKVSEAKPVKVAEIDGGTPVRGGRT